MISLIAGRSTEEENATYAPGRGFQQRGPADELEEALRLARQLSDRLSMPIPGEHAQGVRMRLVRAHALSIVDLLTDIASERGGR
jgi:hypothetical protein